ncbi:unnamed protein product [Euphydryas editha]|uniref:FP protein C-terminal domain-containing protein n=1 Tax=Euphydryas editha TaxID=104508 RepID=A0AAU9TP42_EUPED|nr:unnamed protein product [Euphydryas editha]
MRKIAFQSWFTTLDVGFRCSKRTYKDIFTFFCSTKKQKTARSSDERLMSFKDEIRVMIEAWKESQSSTLNKFVSDIAEIKKQNNEIKHSNEETEKSLVFLNSQYEDMKIKIEGLQNEHIKDVYRLSGKTGKGKIMADFTTVTLKKDVIHAVKTYNKQNPHQRLNSRVIGLNEQATPIFVSEALTNKRRRLFFLARDFARVHNFGYCWTSNARIYVRKTSDSPHIDIKDEKHLNSFKNQM